MDVSCTVIHNLSLDHSDKWWLLLSSRDVIKLGLRDEWRPLSNECNELNSSQT